MSLTYFVLIVLLNLNVTKELYSIRSFRFLQLGVSGELKVFFWSVTEEFVVQSVEFIKIKYLLFCQLSVVPVNNEIKHKKGEILFLISIKGFIHIKAYSCFTLGSLAVPSDGGGLPLPGNSGTDALRPVASNTASLSDAEVSNSTTR